MAPKVLVVLTSQKTMDNGNPTGWYLPEFAHPYYALVGKDEDAPKVEIVTVSPKGGEAPIDEASVAMFAEDKDATLFYQTQQKLWKETRPLREFLGRAGEFDALFYPGGHGPMFDLISDEDSHELIREFYRAGKPVAAVCHGPIVFVKVDVDGKNLLDGKQVTGFSNHEEDLVGLTAAMPQMLEDEIVKAGGKYVKAEEPWHPKVVVDGQLITGQNPNSSHGVGEAIAKAIGL